MNRRKKESKMENNDKQFHDQSKTQKKNVKSSESQKNYCLVSYNELPDYMKDNEFILKYYRSEWPLKRAIFSLFQFHNESVNVWTHLLGFAMFVALTVVNAANVPDAVVLFGFFRTSPNTNTSHDSNKLFTFQDVAKMTTTFNNSLNHWEDNYMGPPKWPFYVYLGGSMVCLLSSTLCHLLCCHSRNLNILLLRMDYAGITVMIITSFFPAIYYIFLCHPVWQIVYLSMISLLGAFTIATLLSPTLSSGKFRTFRAVLFGSMGFFGLVPAVHSAVINWSNPRRNLSIAYEFTMALSYFTGAGFYVSRFPERWRPGWFDLVGHSHQIFHLCVVMGALAHYGAALVFMEYMDKFGCPN